MDDLSVSPAGIEPASQVPETCVLSIERRRQYVIHTAKLQSGQACPPYRRDKARR